MTVLTEAPRTGEFIISEAAGLRSRDRIVVAEGQDLPAGRVIASVVSDSTAASAAKSGGNTGNGTFVLDATTPLLAGASAGLYTARFTSTTNVRLEKEGVVIGDFTIGTSNGNSVTIAEQIKAVVTQGSTGFAAGDGFDITVSSIMTEAVEFNPAGTDGSQYPTGILYAAVDATSGDLPGVSVCRDAEVNDLLVTWKTGATADQKALAKARLADAGIIFRD